MIDGKSVESMFTTRDPVLHKALKSAVASKYSLSSMLQLEPLFDKCMPLFVAEMDKRAGTAIDFGSWCSWYSFDLTGLLSFQELFGFMEQAKDINGVIESSWSFMSYGALVGQYPYLHKYLLGNPCLVRFLDRISNANPMRLITETAHAAIKKYDEKSTDLRGDFLEYLRQKQLKNPETMTDRELINNILIFFVGAVNTNSASLRACFYYLVKTPDTYAKLVKEIQDADAKGLLSENLSFTEGQKLPYLQACIKEALRMYPIVGTPLDRVVPKGGDILSGHFLPEGTVVGISGWATQRDKGIFGDDAESFRPERWLDADKKQVKAMDQSMLAFGQGTRGCVGKYVAMMALTKTVGQIVRVFDMEWAAPSDNAHLRTEHDAQLAWSAEDWVYGRYEKQAKFYFIQVLASGLKHMYVASGDQEEVARFAYEAAEKYVTVSTKSDLLGAEDAAQLGALSLDEQGMVDFLVMLRASKFVSVGR
ncbi:hypothetical protein V495_00048 [Pseudogymnoascus sp. VKM F-4514 (FW-929)]|nr:hypothetical protein V495_00048 [Pseudogymnoascus sp. VKM F-4514 (FW-929)]KFY67968.1 hypothetical protein V497_00103 [Pseudogymnoascus sp. VKM F-4516 (FW-969)]